MSLREQLAAKGRRTCTVPVQVSDLGADGVALEEAARRVLVARLAASGAPDDDPRAVELADALAAESAARTAVAAHYVDVEFTALAPADFEAVVAAFQNADGEIDRATSTPVMAAACAVDEDLRDEAWWTEQLTSDRWSSGEVLELHARLLNLNWSHPPESVPKG